jgi:hypothetical protein
LTKSKLFSAAYGIVPSVIIARYVQNLTKISKQIDPKS